MYFFTVSQVSPEVVFSIPWDLQFLQILEGPNKFAATYKTSIRKMQTIDLMILHRNPVRIILVEFN